MEKPVKTILLITLSNLGDIILTTPVLEKLHMSFPHARVDVVTGSDGKEIFILHPAVRDVYVTQNHRTLRKRVKQIFFLRRLKYDLVVDLKKTLIPFLLGELSCVKTAEEAPSLHKKDEHLSRISSVISDPFSDAGFFLPIKATDVTECDKLIRECDKNIAVINPGAKSHLKRWPAEKFAELSDRLISELGMCVFLVGTDNDREIVSNVMERAGSSPVDLCSKTSLGILSALMRKAKLVITNDSAPLHVASAVNAPTVAIFGPTDEEKYGPLADKRSVVKPKVECRPCEKALCAVGPDEGCMPNITVAEVFSACEEVLR